MRVAVVSCSLSQESRSSILAHAADEDLKALDLQPDLIHLAGMDIPLCDGREAFLHRSSRALADSMEAADGILLAAPVYNYDLNAAAKNLLELTGKHWTGKPVGFLCAAGGQSSYMSVMPFANSLMLDFRCLIIPRFVYATGAAFSDGEIVDTDIRDRIKKLALDMRRLGKALKQD